MLLTTMSEYLVRHLKLLCSKMLLWSCSAAYTALLTSGSSLSLADMHAAIAYSSQDPLPQYLQESVFAFSHDKKDGKLRHTHVVCNCCT